MCHKRSHTNERPFKCPEGDCEASFLRNSHLKAHMVSHKEGDTKPFHCSVCGKGVNSRQHLKRHEITHTQSFACTYPECTETFYKHQSLRHHIMSVHENTLVCHQCDKSFSRPYRLAQHNLKYHGEVPTYQCDHQGCFKSFKNWSALRFHINTDHPKLICPICGKGCVGKVGLESHMTNLHDESKMVRNWKCNYCDMGQFIKKADLIEHYNDLHDGNIPEDLLKATDKEKLDQLLLEATENHQLNVKDLTLISNLNELESDEEEENIQHRMKRDASPYNVSESQRSIISTDSLNVALKSGKTSIRDLILNNYDPKKLVCPKPKCGKKFRRDHDLRRHLKWHADSLVKINAFLDTLDDSPPKEFSTLNDLPTPEETDAGCKRTISDSEFNNQREKKFQKLDNTEIDLEEQDFELDDLIDSELKLLTAGLAHIRE
ncbi:uncharacterized protein KQ657_003723 [Scheffersomyces spartinae]|uniref:Transcription factor IIIA n=1 Tax=Scheffersomyces spartinae TaxID=45513 RepID=A0A9P7VCB9_9ASCO|nr:uncharacterized protein KQ657_003723 [Scheffersomyces spartinae]KAG7195198.1 hypothetical protein KQ657_003723 [Scheffersomyces spartinae]